MSPNPTAFLDAAFAALAHPGRRAILHLLSESGEQTGSQIAAAFQLVSASAVRKHLCLLKRSGLVVTRHGSKSHGQAGGLHDAVTFALHDRFPDGRTVWYTLSSAALDLLSLELACLRTTRGLHAANAV
jgi:DNA-binding transcriptional ArsR family regulator